MLFLAYIVLGALAGYLGGLLGLGGGLIIVPTLYFLFNEQQFAPAVVMHMAVASSLASVIFTAISSLRAHHRRGAVRWDLVRRIVAGLVLGCGIGALLTDALPADGLRRVFGVFELLFAIQIATSYRPDASPRVPTLAAILAAGVFVGTTSTMLGIGGGVTTVMLLLLIGVPIHHAVGTAAACGLPIAIAGTAGMILTGLGNPALPAMTTGYVYWPAVAGVAMASVLTAPLGAATAHAMPVAGLRRVFAVVLAIVGTTMLLQG